MLMARNDIRRNGSRRRLTVVMTLAGAFLAAACSANDVRDFVNSKPAAKTDRIVRSGAFEYDQSVPESQRDPTLKKEAEGRSADHAGGAIPRGADPEEFAAQREAARQANAPPTGSRTGLSGKFADEESVPPTERIKAVPAPAEPAPEDEKFPNLSSVPDQAPEVTPAAERQKILEGLIADRENARYTDEQLRAGSDNSVGAVPPPPPPAATQGEDEAPPS